MGEVPDARAPVLQVDVPQPGAAARRAVRSRRSAVRSRRRRQAGRFGQQRGFGAFFEHDQRVPEIDAAGDIAESMCSGSSIVTPRGTYSSVPPDQQAACSAANLS